jgi:hypothetical protein
MIMGGVCIALALGLEIESTWGKAKVPSSRVARLGIGLLGIALLLPSVAGSLPLGHDRNTADGGGTPPATATPMAPPSTTAASPNITGTPPLGESPTKVSLASRVDDEVVLAVAVLQIPAANQTYWLMVQFKGGGNTVYKALAKISQSRTVQHSIADSASGSTRTYYVLAAAPATATQLQINLEHPEPAWDGNRTNTPDANFVSNKLPVTKP